MSLYMFGNVSSQIVYYNQKRNTLVFKNDYLFDEAYMYRTGEENGVIKFVYEDDDGEKEVFSSFGASQYEFCSNDTCTVFSVYCFFTYGLGTCSDIVCIDVDELPCRPPKSEAGLVLRFKIEKGVFSFKCSFNSKVELSFIKELPPIDEILSSPFYYQDFFNDIIVLMMQQGYDNEYIHRFVKEFDIEFHKSDEFKEATNIDGYSQYLYPSMYFFMRNIYSILLPIADKELSLEQFLLLNKDLKHIFDDVRF